MEGRRRRAEVWSGCGGGSERGGGGGGEHADESKSVIAMKVCEEDGLEMGEGETGTSECHLGALCTIEHEEFLTNVDDL